MGTFISDVTNILMPGIGLLKMVYRLYGIYCGPGQDQDAKAFATAGISSVKWQTYPCGVLCLFLVTTLKMQLMGNSAGGELKLHTVAVK